MRGGFGRRHHRSSAFCFHLLRVLRLAKFGVHLTLLFLPLIAFGFHLALLVLTLVALGFHLLFLALPLTNAFGLLFFLEVILILSRLFRGIAVNDCQN